MSEPTWEYRDYTDLNGTKYVDDGVRPEGSASARDLFVFANSIMGQHKIKLEPQLPADWSFKLGRYKYPEMWLRRYAALRHGHPCTVLASDYANKATRVHLPIVRSDKLDFKLLCAFASMAKLAPKPVHYHRYKQQQNKGQNNEREGSNRTDGNSGAF